jgi:flagellar motor switch protein FliG
LDEWKRIEKMSDDGVMRSAILMLALGEDEAAEVMKFLSPKEVQKLGAAMATMKSVGHEQVNTVVTEFLTVAEQSSSFGLDSDEYIRSVLNKALGEDKASGLLNRILQSRDSSGIESLKWMDAPTVAEFIKNEHPQIIATILVHLEPDQASAVIANFTDRLRQDVMLRIATLDGVKPIALRELNDVMTKLLTGNENIKKQTMGGIKVAAEIMNFMNGENEASVMEGLKTYDEEMAQKIMDQMFVFDNILDIDDKGIQVILKEVQSETLIVALKGTTEEIRDKIFKNMSSRAAEMMKEDLETKGPVKLSEVEAQQKEILQIVRRLADEGQIQLAGKGGDDQYV